MAFWIRTTNEAQQREWEHIYGLDQLPVTTDRPILIRTGPRRKQAVYVLDTEALSDMQICRLAGHIKRQCRVSYDTALVMVEGWTITAENCEPVADESPAVLFIEETMNKLAEFLKDAPEASIIGVMVGPYLSEHNLAMIREAEQNEAKLRQEQRLRELMADDWPSCGGVDLGQLPSPGRTTAQDALNRVMSEIDELGLKRVESRHALNHQRKQARSKQPIPRF